MRRSSGVIVVAALIMVAGIAMVTEQLIRTVLIGSRFAMTMVEREKAKVLALSGVQIAIAQLIEAEKKVSEEEKNREQDAQKKPELQSSVNKKLLKFLLSHLNRWKTYSFTEKQDGIEGALKICLVSEHGKINVNEAFDFEKQVFKKEYELLIEGLVVEQKLPAGKFLKLAQEYLSQRKKKLDDLSELLDIKGLAGIDFIYRPPEPTTQKGEEDQPNSMLTLQDIFTIWGDQGQLHPLLLTDGLCAMLRLRRPLARDGIKMKEVHKKIVAEYRDSWAQNWEQSWQNFVPMYGDKIPPLKNLPTVFAKQFEPSIYSVLSYGKIGQTEQQLLAIIKKEKVQNVASQADNQVQAKTVDEDQHRFRIIRLYWL